MMRKIFFTTVVLVALGAIAYYFFSDYPGKNYFEETYGKKPWIEVLFYYEFEISKNYSYSGIKSASPCTKKDKACVFKACDALAVETAAYQNMPVSDGIWLCGIEPRFFFEKTSYEYILYSQNFPEGFEMGPSLSVRNRILNLLWF